MPRRVRLELPDDVEALLSGLRFIAAGAILMLIGLVVFWASNALLRYRAIPFPIFVALWSWVGQPFRGDVPAPLIAWLMTGLGVFGGLTLLFGKGVSLGGIEDSESRRPVIGSMMLDLLGWGCVLGAYAFGMTRRSPDWYLPHLALANVGVFVLALSAVTYLGLVTRAASYLRHEDLQEKAIKDRRWIGVFLLICVLLIVLHVLAVVPLPRRLNMNVLVWSTIGVELVAAVTALGLILRGASTASRLRRALKLHAEALVAPAPAEFV